jgi:hypothetical protein
MDDFDLGLLDDKTYVRSISRHNQCRMPMIAAVAGTGLGTGGPYQGLVSIYFLLA